MRYLSVCSGIEAASVAWGPLGWQAAAFSEIEPFPCAVLAHHYHDVPNLGDMTTIARRILNGEVEAPDVLAGGTPCTSFSIAGLRKSLADERGNLTLKFVEIADAIDSVRVRDGRPPAIVFWENVPGVLSTHDNAFGCFLAGLAGEDCELKPPGKRWADAGCVFGPQRSIAWRVLDAQYFGLAQRRRRVFVVSSARDGFDPAAVLFEFEGVRRDSAPSREAREKVAAGTDSGAAVRGWPAEVSSTLTVAFGSVRGLDNLHVNAGCPLFVPAAAPTIPARSSGCGGLGTDFDCDGGLIAHTLRGEGFDASEDGTGRGTPLVPVDFDPTQITSATNRSNPRPGDPCHTLAKGAHAPAIAFSEIAACRLSATGAGFLTGNEQMSIEQNVAGVSTPSGLKVRRLTPEECEALQGFPRGYTAIPWRGKPASDCPDGPRYRALGNSWAVPVVRWIGERINAAVEQIKHGRKAS